MLKFQSEGYLTSEHQIPAEPVIRGISPKVPGEGRPGFGEYIRSKCSVNCVVKAPPRIDWIIAAVLNKRARHGRKLHRQCEQRDQRRRDRDVTCSNTTVRKSLLRGIGLCKT